MASRKVSPEVVEPVAVRLEVNGERHELAVDPATPLLWVLRDALGLTGTKYGCGIAQCGACTVHADGTAVRSCVLRVAAVGGRRITTIEGLATASGLHPLQRAWLEDDVVQCGYCQSGQLMAAAALLARNPRPSDEDVDRAMSGNVCRCGTYGRVRRAIHRAAAMLAAEAGDRPEDESGR
jgi:isoquinoline 1-oxidoreductase subunit alpha